MIWWTKKIKYKMKTSNTTSKITWKFLSQFNINNPPLVTLNRSTIINRNYNLLKLYLKSKDININTYICNKFFGGEKQFKEYLFIGNEYPYNIERGINHYNLWINPKLEKIFNNKKILELINKILSGKKYIIFKNLSNNLSVSKLLHYHIFFKN
jgi:hypothetical protein